MFPFTINGKRKVDIDPKYFSEYLKRLQEGLMVEKGISEVYIYGNTLKINIAGKLALKKINRKDIIGFRSFIGYFNTCEFTVLEEDGKSFLRYKISFVPLFSLTFIFLPFMLISLLPGDASKTFEKVWYFYFWTLIPIYCISLIEYFLFIYGL